MLASGRRWGTHGEKVPWKMGTKVGLGLGEVFVAATPPSMRGCRRRGCAEELQFILQRLRFKRCLHENFTSISEKKRSMNE